MFRQSEVNNAAAQQREVHEAARRRLEGDLAQLADAAAGLSDKVFFALKVRARRVAVPLQFGRLTCDNPREEA